MESIEIIAVVESVSNEKGIEEGIIFGALEIAIASASLRPVSYTHLTLPTILLV